MVPKKYFAGSTATHRIGVPQVLCFMSVVFVVSCGVFTRVFLGDLSVPRSAPESPKCGMGDSDLLY